MAMTMAIVNTAAAVTSAAVSSYASYQQGKEQKRQSEAQAANAEYQAKLETERAGIAQIQSEQEAEKRSRQLAADIGSSYASWAGNGMLVDGSGRDTLGSVLSTQVAEGQSDIDAIKDSGAIEVWTHQSSANALRASAANYRAAGKSAMRAGKISAFGESVGGIGKAVGGFGSTYGGYKGAGATQWGTGTMFS